ncbi:hypothetical protein OROMI_032520 [Orobanche minor]
MAGSDSHKQMFTLIRDFSTEKSQGERRIVNQKKRIEELRSELDASSAELEKAKRDKETAEQQLKGYEVELSMNEASIQALEARIALTNNEISNLGAELAALKSEENSSRDGFIKQMLELNSQIRKFQELLPSMGNCSEATLNDGPLPALEQDPQQSRVVLQNKLTEIVMRTDQGKEQYEAEQVIHDQMRYKQETSELEGKFAALGDELQKRFLCPRCHHDNSEELGEILQLSNVS